MKMFENTIIHGIYATRFVASWVKEGGTLEDCDYLRGTEHPFGQWLRSLIFIDDNGERVHMTEEEVWSVIQLASNGKLELEESAKKFIENYNEK